MLRFMGRRGSESRSAGTEPDRAGRAIGCAGADTTPGDLSTHPSHVRRVGPLVALLIVASGACSSLPPRDGGASAGTLAADPVVAGFAVSDDLSVATVNLRNAAGMIVSGPTGPLAVGHDGTLRVPLTFAGATKPGTVSAAFSGPVDGVIEIRYYPRNYYAAIGLDFAGTVLLYTTLPRSADPAVQAPTSLPPDQSLDVHQQRWTDARYVGALPSAADPLGEQIRQLYDQFDRLNHPAVGQLCSDFMIGIDTYWAMSSQSCYVWCSGYARITRGFLRSDGVPARLIGLSAGVASLSSGVEVQSSEGHVTMDMWLNGEWRWIDPTFRLLRAVDATGTPLTVEAAIRDMADASTRDGLSFTRLDPVSRQWVTLPYSAEDQEFKDDLASYMTADKQISVPNGGRG
jgi:hypothetical protein